MSEVAHEVPTVTRNEVDQMVRRLEAATKCIERLPDMYELLEHFGEAGEEYTRRLAHASETLMTAVDEF